MNRALNILIACEHSGAIRDAFINRNSLVSPATFAAYSNDLPELEPEGEWTRNHLKGDCLWWMANPPRDLHVKQWDLIIAHPPCTYVSSSGLHWNKRPEGIASGRPAKTEAAVAFARQLIDSEHAPFVAVENPIKLFSHGSSAMTPARPPACGSRACHRCAMDRPST